MQKIGKFDKKIKVIRNGMEKRLTFMLRKNLVYIGNMQNSCPEVFLGKGGLKI